MVRDSIDIKATDSNQLKAIYQNGDIEIDARKAVEQQSFGEDR